MKIHIHFNEIEETVEVKDADEALSRLKIEAASHAPLMFRGVIKNMGNIPFAREAVKRDNAANNLEQPLPNSAGEFLDWAVGRGYATVLEP
jgi:hypothetical protein